MRKKLGSPTNRLFLICPSSHLENIIKKHYGSNTYYLTALGAVFNLSKIDYAEAVANFLRNKPIAEIYLTQDTENIFMKNILGKRPGFGTSAEKVLLDLLIDNYSSIMGNPSLQEQLNCFAGFAMQQQAGELMANTLVREILLETNASLKGLLINRSRNQLKEINLNLTEVYK